jgi:hypothetical protein
MNCGAELGRKAAENRRDSPRGILYACSFMFICVHLFPIPFLLIYGSFSSRVFPAPSVAATVS